MFAYHCHCWFNIIKLGFYSGELKEGTKLLGPSANYKKTVFCLSRCSKYSDFILTEFHWILNPSEETSRNYFLVYRRVIKVQLNFE